MFFRVQRLVAAALATLMVCGGCATIKGPSDEEQVKMLTTQALAAAQAKDIDKLLTYFADDFDHPQLGDKEMFTEFLKSAKDSGYLDGLQVTMDDAVTKIEGDSATVAPVSVEGAFGSVSVDFTGKKVKGVWKISEMDLQM